MVKEEGNDPRNDPNYVKNLFADPNFETGRGSEKVKIGSLAYNPVVDLSDPEIEKENFEEPTRKDIRVPKDFDKIMENFNPEPVVLLEQKKTEEKEVKVVEKKEKGEMKEEGKKENRVSFWSIFRQSIKFSIIGSILFLLLDFSLLKEKLGMTFEFIMSNGDHNFFSTLIRSGLFLVVSLFSFIILY